MDGWCLRWTGCKGKVHKVVLLRDGSSRASRVSRSSGTSSSRYSGNGRGEGRRRNIGCLISRFSRSLSDWRGSLYCNFSKRLIIPDNFWMIGILVRIIFGIYFGINDRCRNILVGCLSKSDVLTLVR